MSTNTCGDCGAKEGDLHQWGCDMEPCPFCGGQLLSCDCAEKRLGQSKGLQKNNLTEKRWMTILNKKGRVPFILYPNICAKCGVLWPEMFMVPDHEWKRYIQKDKRHQIICRRCYDHIVALINAAEIRRSHGPSLAGSESTHRIK
jgi:hypothetical protein